MTFHQNGSGRLGYYTCNAKRCDATLQTYKDIIDDGWGRKFEKNAWLHFCPLHIDNTTTSEPLQPDSVFIQPDGPLLIIREPEDLINHPKHYLSHPSGVECIDIIKHMDYRLGSVIKYLWRAGLKDGNPTLQDLRKAQWYLNSKIEDLEKEQ